MLIYDNQVAFLNRGKVDQAWFRLILHVIALCSIMSNYVCLMHTGFKPVAYKMLGYKNLRIIFISKLAYCQKVLSFGFFKKRICKYLHFTYGILELSSCGRQEIIVPSF